ncbi:hypothetical protein Syun_018529 [Stephania yunnanensis]|uniref:Uncharacterized protein n=1 Tax=Stephania yunnanensis TaxID=152371 RepID=A0AAP0ISE3_9MAGN
MLGDVSGDVAVPGLRWKLGPSQLHSPYLSLRSNHKACAEEEYKKASTIFLEIELRIHEMTMKSTLHQRS